MAYTIKMWGERSQGFHDWQGHFYNLEKAIKLATILAALGNYVEVVEGSQRIKALDGRKRDSL